MAISASHYKQTCFYAWGPAIDQMARLPWSFSVHWFSDHGILRLAHNHIAKIQWADSNASPNGTSYDAVSVSIISLTSGVIIVGEFRLDAYITALDEHNDFISAQLVVKGKSAKLVYGDEKEESIGKHERDDLHPMERCRPLTEAIDHWLFSLFGGAFLAVEVKDRLPTSIPNPENDPSPRQHLATDEAPVAILDEPFP